MTTITLGSVALQETGRQGWVFHDLTDWWGQTSNKQGRNERPRAHGSFRAATARRSSRAVSFGASYLGASQAEVEAAVDDLAAVGAEGPVVMTVSTPAGATWRQVTVEVTAFEDHHGRSTGEAVVHVVADDPRRYGQGGWATALPAQAGGGMTWPAMPGGLALWPSGGRDGRMTLANTGKAPSAPLLRLYGGFDTALVTVPETGSMVGLAYPLPDGAGYVEIDYAAHTAKLNGVSDLTRWLRFREWDLVPPGGQLTFQLDVTGPQGAPYMTGKVDPAWW